MEIACWIVLPKYWFKNCRSFWKTSVCFTCWRIFVYYFCSEVLPLRKGQTYIKKPTPTLCCCIEHTAFLVFSVNIASEKQSVKCDSVFGYLLSFLCISSVHEHFKLQLQSAPPPLCNSIRLGLNIVSLSTNVQMFCTEIITVIMQHVFNWEWYNMICIFNVFFKNN